MRSNKRERKKNMDKNEMIISTEVFAELVQAEEKLQVIKRLLEADGYMATSTLKAILNIEGGKENESV